ncbi:MAG: GtrA family protein [Betaproteobacteria bacterium]|nr:GtrA family protein [Betaproteobacteria bacterium]
MRTGIWFVLVGASAALTHMAVFTLVLLLVPTLWPELVNVAGFLVAFLVSFVGHRRLSFQDADTSLLQSFMRFAATAVAGFVTNEAVFIALFRVLELPTWLALIGGIVVSAVQTFVLSRFWAFRRSA